MGNIESHCYVCNGGLTEYRHKERKSAFQIVFEKLFPETKNLEENASVCFNCHFLLAKTEQTKQKIGSFEREIKELEESLSRKVLLVKLEGLQSLNNLFEMQLNDIMYLAGRGSGRKQTDIKSDLQNVLEEESKKVGKLQEEVGLKLVILDEWIKTTSSVHKATQDTIKIDDNDRLKEERLSGLISNFMTPTEFLSPAADDGRVSNNPAFIPAAQVAPTDTNLPSFNFLQPKLTSEFGKRDSLGSNEIFSSVRQSNRNGSKGNQISPRQSGKVMVTRMVEEILSNFPSNQNSRVQSESPNNLPFTSRVSENTFRTKSSLLRFYKQRAFLQRTGAEDEPVVCKTCEKVFMQTCELKNHEKMHTREKRHVCVKCNKRFRKGRHLRLHEKTHSEEKPFVCKVCLKRFKVLRSLKSHEKTVHKE